jgi:hypothetical protein
MEITEQKLNRFFYLSETAEQLDRDVSELIISAKENQGKIKHIIQRNGQPVDILELDLWLEYHYGNPDATKILSEKYPTIFEKSKEKEKIAEELSNFCATEFGFNFRTIKPSQLIRLVIDIVNYKLKEKEKENGYRD